MTALIISAIGLCFLLLYVILCLPKILFFMAKFIFAVVDALVNFCVWVANQFVNLFGFGVRLAHYPSVKNTVAERELERQRLRDSQFQSDLNNTIHKYEQRLEAIKWSYMLADQSLYKEYAEAIVSHQFNLLSDIERRIINSHNTNLQNVTPANHYLCTLEDIKNVRPTYTYKSENITCHIIEFDSMYIIKAIKDNNVTRLFQTMTFIEARDKLSLVVQIMKAYNRPEVLNEWL